MNYKVASNFEEVMDAWRLVYKQYLAKSLIRPNELAVFTFPEYISNNIAVILGNYEGITVCTVSAVLDSEQGLPLDNSYKKELDELRSNKKLIEVGLLADTRSTGNFSTIVELMAGIARFGVYSGHHDFVIGVNPRRINFFEKTFGFQVCGEEKDHSDLKAAPVVLLHVNGEDIKTAALKVKSQIYSDIEGFNFKVLCH